MYDFNYHRAGSVADASGRLGQTEDGKLLAGGMTLIPTLKQRLASHSDLVDLGGLDELQGIQVEGETLIIGAMTTHATVAASDEVRRMIPALADLAGGVGDPQVRNRGTIGGSIANHDPSADYPAGCLGLNATVVTDQREIAADDFFTGLFETALKEDEIITSVRFPKPQAAAYQKFKQPASRYALVGVMVVRTTDGVRVAVTGAGQNGVFRAKSIETALNSNFSADVVDSSSIELNDLISDLHAQADYRQHLIGVLTRRAVAACG